MNDLFRRLAQNVSGAVGSPYAFVFALAIVVAWALSGPLFGFSDTWQLVINTGTTIVTFLVVFMIQNTQNRDARAIHVKLDELLRAVDKARNTLVDAEDLSDEDLAALTEEFRQFRAQQSRTRQAASNDSQVNKRPEKRGVGV
jgi:low affinity Fe/Cu permease